MKRPNLRPVSTLLLIPLLALVGCIGEVPDESSEDGFIETVEQAVTCSWVQNSTQTGMELVCTEDEWTDPECPTCNQPPPPPAMCGGCPDHLVCNEETNHCVSP
jgi:hypothetical protein